MIKSFKCKESEKVLGRFFSKKLPQNIQIKARQKLILIDAAVKLSDLQIPPGNWLEELKDDRKGQYNIRINDQRNLTKSNKALVIRDVSIVFRRVENVKDCKRNRRYVLASVLPFFVVYDGSSYETVSITYAIKAPPSKSVNSDQLFTHIPFKILLGEVVIELLPLPPHPARTKTAIINSIILIIFTPYSSDNE